MIRFISKLAVITGLIVSTISYLPTKTSAVTYSNQQVTCYNANALTEFPARSGYKYILGVTAASQYKVYNTFSGGPRIPFGTIVTLSQVVDLPGPINVDTNRFRIDDMGDKYQTRTPYFVDIYFGPRQEPYKSACKGGSNEFGERRMSVTF